MDDHEQLGRAVKAAVSAALAEDLGDRGDVTTDAVVPKACSAVGRFVAREAIVVAGVQVAGEVFRQLDNALELRAAAREGERVEAGTVIAEVTGSARPILRGERTALNFLMRMSGIATETRRVVDEIAGTGARILDTRKTAPGLRAIDKLAVKLGGAENHRMGLYDAAMIKDTHLALGMTIPDAVRDLLAAGLDRGRITVEVRDPEGLREAIEAGAGRALLDNMGLDALRECVRIARGEIVLEASGGLRPGRLRAVAETGVDFLSLGWLTHSARAADLALEVELRP